MISNWKTQYSHYQLHSQDTPASLSYSELSLSLSLSLSLKLFKFCRQNYLPSYFISTLKLEKFSKFVNTEIKRVRIEFLIQTQVKTSLFPPLIINFANRLPKETNIKKFIGLVKELLTFSCHKPSAGKKSILPSLSIHSADVRESLIWNSISSFDLSLELSYGSITIQSSELCKYFRQIVKFLHWCSVVSFAVLMTFVNFVNVLCEAGDAGRCMLILVTVVKRVTIVTLSLQALLPTRPPEMTCLDTTLTTPQTCTVPSQKGKGFSSLLPDII